MEEILLGIYTEVLKLNRVGIRDNFFEIGGHSLLATQVVSRVRDVFGVEVGIRSIFEAAAVEDFARKIEEAMSQGQRAEALPLLRVSREEKLPLSFAQQRLWFIDQLVPNNPLYNIPCAVKLKGKLNLRVLEKVINEIVRRHEALRTRFETVEGDPIQLIDPWRPRKLEIGDLTALDAEEREEEGRRIARKDALTGFDLSRGPLMRVKVFKFGEEHHMALIAMHHIVSDAWSMGILIKEMLALYSAYSADEESPLEELPIQYADYAKWQRDYLVGDVLKDEVGYWMEQLKDVTPLELPTDHARPVAPSYQGGRERIELGWPLSEALRRLSQREGATLFMVLMAAFKALLTRYSGLEDVVVGTVIANRTRKEVEGLIGFFANTLVLRTDLGGNPTFKELIRREREVALEAYGHQQAPFEKLVEEINPDRDLSRSPLFQVMMVLQNTAREEVGIKGLEVERIDTEIGSAKFDLMLMLTEEREGIAGSLEYALDLYDAATIGRMAGHYKRIVEEAIRDAERRIREIQLLSPEEKTQVIVEFNRTERNYERGRCIQDLIEACAERVGHKTAVVYEEEAITYQELNARANQVARRLIRQGVNIEDRVGFCLERSIEMVIGMLGIIKAGAAYVPLDPSYPKERLEHMLNDAEVKMLVTEERLKAVFADHDRATICIDSDWPSITGESRQNPDRNTQAENLAYVIYTSGSTGSPKGVAITHRSAVTLVNWASEVFSEEELNGVLASTSICFDLSVFELIVPLSSGGKVVIAKNALSLPDLKAASEVRLINTVPSAVRELVGKELTVTFGIPDSVQTVNLAGEPLRRDLVQQIYDGGKVNRVLNLYGPTEDTTYSTWTVVSKQATGEPTLGRPIANTAIHILDKEMTPLPIGVYGEIYISGEGLARCYLNRPGITAEKFLPNPFGGRPGERLYSTGDIGRYFVNGDVEYKGRGDHQVKIRGYRIELGEIERALEQKEGIREAVVVAREENPGDKRLTAYVVLERGREQEIKGLRKYLKEKLPEYMTPSAIVALEKMPLTPNGKLDRKALPTPGQEGAGDEAGFVAPRTPVEEIVAGLFKSVLEVDRVGVIDNFFEIGGHSLLATRVISRVRATFGVGIGIRSIFEQATVEGLAHRIEEAIGRAEREETPPLLRVSREGRLPLSFAQQRLWFLDQLAPNNPFYNLPVAVKLEGMLDLQVLERVIGEIIRRHEALRTRIEVEEGKPVQVIDEWEHRSLTVEDLTRLTPEEREEKVRRIAGEEAGTGFDLRRGPMLRVKVLKLGKQEHVVLFTMHHIVSDGWSMEILNKEVGALYRAYSAGELSPLDELPIQYVDFAVWQRTWLQGEVLDRELAYWRAQLVGVQELDLPTDHPRPAAPSYRGARGRFVVERELAGKLKGLSQREGVTLFMTLLAGFDVLMSRYRKM
jgi:amino acid adenylation domain-containing protein